MMLMNISRKQVATVSPEDPIAVAARPARCRLAAEEWEELHRTDRSIVIANA
jgi:hypothetical protein